MAKGIKNNTASVHQRLLNQAKQSRRPFGELLQYYAIERFIYRLAKSPHADKFILKGTLMFSAWCGPASRPTMDIDLWGIIDNRLEVITAAIKDACLPVVEADGISFDAKSLEATRITEVAEYKGVRVRVRGNLGNARIAIQIDIGFGDVIVPKPCSVAYPTILDFPAPELKGYTMESTTAEKFQAMVKPGVLNSRMKDFYDIWVLSLTFDFKGRIIAEAVERTFEKRNTPVTLDAYLFNPAFSNDESKDIQWKAFLRRTRLINAPESFLEIVDAVKRFLEPIAVSLAEGRVFNSNWSAPGPWP